MLVNEYFEEEISQRPFRYQTKLNMIRCLKKLELWDLEYSKVNSQLCWNKIEGLLNQNVKRTYAGYVRNIFGYSQKQIPVVMGISKTYDLPTQQELHRIIERSKYKLQLLLCMYAGLRIGEACAVVPKQVIKDKQNYYLNVDRAFSQDGNNLSSPKTIGKVLIPEWLALMILEIRESEYWQKGVPTKRVTTACYSLSSHGQKIHINPHMLRHWFATDMARRNVPVHVIMRQMRHKNVQTAMAVYAQINNSDLIDSLPMRPEDKVIHMGKVVNLFD
jgi:integrase